MRTRQLHMRTPADAKLHAAAKQFDAMFMTEMLHHARPPAHAAGVFAPGVGERSWQVFMDQALGQAAAAGGGSGLVKQIENSLRAAQDHGAHGSVSKRSNPNGTLTVTEPGSTPPGGGT